MTHLPRKARPDSMAKQGGNSAMTELEVQRERAKRLMFSPEKTAEETHEGLQLMLRACDAGDPEAMFIIGKMLLDGHLDTKTGSRIEQAVNLLCCAARRGDPSARTLLLRFQRERHMQTRWNDHLVEGPLIGFDGKEIHIHRTGLLTPVDAVLSYDNGQNVLALSLNLDFFEDEETLPDVNALHRAVIRGIKSWAGKYTVFGGQQLRVVIRVTTEPRWFDNVTIIVCSGEIAEALDNASRLIPLHHVRKNREALFRDHRAMARVGVRKWSVRSRKVILLQTSNGRFDNYREITDIVRHEFGHVLGLGDLYAEPEDSLPGVPAGTYPELDAYLTDGRAYNLVMCNSDGKITDNDMEMVVLAFSKNRPQSYQPCRFAQVVSEALGKGN